MTGLILKRAFASRSSGEWRDDEDTEVSAMQLAQCAHARGGRTFGRGSATNWLSALGRQIPSAPPPAGRERRLARPRPPRGFVF
jgi:hypothetical protein